MLGLLGALDPYKHKVNIGMIDQSRDASAVSLSESKSSQDSGNQMHLYIFEHACLCNGCMPVRAVCKPHSPDLKKRRSSD